MRETPQPGEVYRHFKNGLYKIICTAESTSFGREDIVYINSQGKYWTRPASEFLGDVKVEAKSYVPRFEKMAPEAWEKYLKDLQKAEERKALIKTLTEKITDAEFIETLMKRSDRVETITLQIVYGGKEDGDTPTQEESSDTPEKVPGDNPCETCVDPALGICATLPTCKHNADTLPCCKACDFLGKRCTGFKCAKILYSNICPARSPVETCKSEEDTSDSTCKAQCPTIKPCAGYKTSYCRFTASEPK